MFRYSFITLVILLPFVFCTIPAKPYNKQSDRPKRTTVPTVLTNKKIGQVPLGPFKHSPIPHKPNNKQMDELKPTPIPAKPTNKQRLQLHTDRFKHKPISTKYGNKRKFKARSHLAEDEDKIGYLQKARNVANGFQSTFEAVKDATSSAKDMVEGIKSGIDMGAKIISEIASFGGPVGEAIGIVGNTLSGIVKFFVGGPTKSDKMEKKIDDIQQMNAKIDSDISVLTTMTKEGFNQVLADIGKLEQITVNGFQATMNQIDKLEINMEKGFDKVTSLITETDEKHAYNDHHDRVTEVYRKYQEFIKSPDAQNLETVKNNMNDLIITCSTRNPSGVVDWFCTKITDETYMNKNLLMFLSEKFKDDTVGFTQVLSAVSYDILTALEMTAVCTALKGTTGLSTAQNLVKNALTKINQAIQHRKTDYMLENALQFAKSKMVSVCANAPQPQLEPEPKYEPIPEPTQKSIIYEVKPGFTFVVVGRGGKHKNAKRAKRFVDEFQKENNTLMQEKLKEKFPWHNWTAITIWFLKQTKDSIDERRTSTVASDTCSPSGRIVIHAVPINATISAEFTDKINWLNGYQDSFKRGGSGCPDQQKMIEELNDQIRYPFLVAVYFNILKADLPAINAFTKFVLLPNKSRQKNRARYCAGVLISAAG